MNIEFIYVLTGWEGSAVDSRVLRDAMHRPTDLRIPTGNYYLCDNGYTNGEGFLTPYRKVRYHLREWDRVAAGPQNKEELFNLKHSSARNVIECAFGLLKVRWAILRSHSFYHVKVHNRIIMACCYLIIFNVLKCQITHWKRKLPNPLNHTLIQMPRSYLPSRTTRCGMLGEMNSHTRCTPNGWDIVDTRAMQK
ncbi:UNVERIFIED_CONTAM: hypothetical protein Slati_2182900 [Sesamum latifolium]|uniref:DDE Tnp4 domain-containing protein n=1 Tax=Sesamum latifolium TaxID=2727402 RepID=A0AAW2WVQ8_9LAMI